MKSETLAGLLKAFNRIPWWVILVGTLLDVVAIMGVLFGRFALEAAILGVAVGSVYVLGASGLSLTYGIKKFANFAHGDMMTVGAYVAFAVSDPIEGFGANIFLGVAVAVLSVALLGVFLELSIFRRLEGRGPVAPLIASVGVALVLQNVVSLVFSSDPKHLPVSVGPDVSLGFGLSINPVQDGLTIVVAIVLIVFLHVLLRYTTLGKAMRACADDLELSRTSGIDTRNVILWTWGISGALAAVAGVLIGIIVNLTPFVGFFLLLFIFAAVIIGGIGHPYGAMIGGLIVGVIQKLSSVVLTALQAAHVLEGGSAYEPAGAFLAMIFVLLVRPEGIMGTHRERLGARSIALRVRRATAR